MALVGRTEDPWLSSRPSWINSKTARVSAPLEPISRANSGIVRPSGRSRSSAPSPLVEGGCAEPANAAYDSPASEGSAFRCQVPGRSTAAGTISSVGQTKLAPIRLCMGLRFKLTHHHVHRQLHLMK